MSTIEEVVAQNHILRILLERARDDIAFMAQTVHQAHHPHHGQTWEECGTGICNYARIVIPTLDTQIIGLPAPPTATDPRLALSIEKSER